MTARRHYTLVALLTVLVVLGAMVEAEAADRGLRLISAVGSLAIGVGLVGLGARALSAPPGEAA